MFNYEGKDQDYMNFAEYMRTLGKMPSQEYTNAYMSQMNPEALGEANMKPEQPQDDSWGGFRGFAAGGAGVLQGQAQLGNLAGFGDGSTANYMGEIMQRNARKKEYTIADMFPFASDYWTSGEGAAYDIGNMLGSSVVLGGETALAAATGGAALGALGVGNAAAAAATAAGSSATAARAAFMTKAITGGMGRAAAKMGMPKLGKVLEGPMGTLYAMNILKTPLEASSEAGNAGAEALANGASLSDAQRQALIVGGLQMPLLALSNTIESSGLGGLFLKEAEKAGGKKLGKEGLLAILGNITREGVNNAWEEGMQQSTHEYAQGKQNLLGVVNPLQWSDEALQQAAVGGVGGLAIGGGNAAMRAFSTRGDETAPPQAQEAAEAQENTTMPEAPAQEESVAPTTPAESAAEYLDAISQQDENLSMEQRRGIWDVLDSGNEQAIVDVATQFGWQPPVEQAVPAPVTPATTPEQQIQTAIDNVNAATANVANGGEVVEPAAARPPMPVVESISGGGKVEYPTNPPTFGVAENTVDQNGVKVWLNSVSRAAHEKLSKGNKTRKYLDSDGNINTMALRASPALRRFIDETPNAVENLKAALSGNKEAMAWFSKLSPTRQAALVDVLNHGVENWQVTDGDRRSFALYDLRQQLYQKAKNLKGKAKTKLYASLKNSDDNELIKIAKEYGLAIPDIVYGKREPTAPIATPTQPVSNNTTEPIVEPATNAPIEEPAVESNTGGGNVTSAINAIISGNNGNAATPAAPATSTDTNGATPARNKRLAPISIGGVQTIPQVSSDGTKLAFSLPEVFLPRQTIDDMKAAGFFYNSELKAIVADNTEAAQNFLKKYAVKESGNDIDNGGKENETDKDGEGSKGGDQGSENSVQNKEPQEPVKAKTGDDQGEDKNGETGEVDAPKSEPEKTGDENGVTPIPHDAKPDAVKKLQQANTEIIMGKVKAIEKQYEDGELDANAARKAISAFFQKYSQSKAVNKAYSAGTDEKINSIKKGITAKEAEKKRVAAANAASADKQAKEEAKQKKKKLYQDTLSEFDEKAKAVLSKHKEQELSDVDAIAELDKITKELEERLVANDDKLLVKDKKSFYEDRVKTIKKQQAEIDKAILEAATTEAIAGSSESLTPEGLEAYKWVKQQLSADAKKRYSEKGIDAVAALIAFRAQTWSKLYNKYAKTNFTPLTFAQRYKFVLHDGRIPKFEKSGGVTHTIEELGNKQSHIDMAITSDEGVLVHELGHVFFADFVAVAESPDAPAQLKKDLAILREWIGDGQRSEEELKKPYRQSAQAAGKWKDEERFSQALVKHVYAGDTPVPWLNKMFAELKRILESYIKGVQFRINKALASPEKTKETEGYAKAYRTDFEIPAEIKRIINEMIYYKEADAVTYDDKMQVIKALNNELDATFIEEEPPEPKRLNELKQRIIAVGKGSKEYSPEQNAVLEAASKACQTKAELGLLEQKARIAYNEVEEGNVSAVNVESAASALLEGNPMEFETIPKEACDLLLKGLDEQQRNDVVDLDVEDKVARAVVADYAVEGKLDDEFEQVRDDLKADGFEEDGIKSVAKYADYVLCMLHKYAAIYNKQKKLEEAEKAYEDAVAALKKAEAEKKLKELVDKKGDDGNKDEDSNTTPNPFDYLPEKTRKSKLGKAMYQAAWHGTPNIIEGNLTTERIGTGEGGAVHGWGLYFAKSRDVSQKRYREGLVKREGLKPRGEVRLIDSESGEELVYEADKRIPSYGELNTPLLKAAYALHGYGENIDEGLEALQAYIEREVQEIDAIMQENELLTRDEINSYQKYIDDLNIEDYYSELDPWDDIDQYKYIESLNHEETIKELEARKKEIAQYQKAMVIVKNADTSQVKPAGELLSVEIPENDVLLNEQYKFERQPFRVRAALERIFEKLPVEETPTNGWKDGVRALKDLLVTDDDEVVYKLLLPFYEKYNADFAESGPENYHDRESELHKEVSRLVSDIVDESTKEIREIISRENAGKKEDEIDWYGVVNKVYKQLDEKQKAIETTGIFDTMEEFGLDYTIASMKRNIVYNLTQRHNSELFKPFSLPTKTKDERKWLKGKTGYDIYQKLGMALGGGEDCLVYVPWHHRYEINLTAAKKASMALKQHGLKGIRYWGGLDGESFVIFDDNAIAIKERYDAALRRRGAELQRSREEVVGNIKKLFAGSKFEEQENGDLLITTKNGKKLLYKISDRIVLNEAEAQEARKAHGISEDVEVTAEGRYRSVYENDINSIVEVGLDSRKNTEAHEATHAVIDLALGKEKAKPLFDRAEKLKKEYGLKADAEEIACDAVRDFITARENGFITTFTTKEVAELKKTFWGRMLLKANSMGAKAKVFSNKNETELKKTTWGKMLLAKMQLQRCMAKLMRAVYDFYKKFQAVREANDNFHNLARKIELGEVWGEKISANRERNTGIQGDESVKYSARYAKKDKDLQVSSINLNYKKQLEDAFARNATDGEIAYIMNQHQKELASYLKDKDEKQKERAKLRAAEIRSLRKKLHAKEIESFALSGAIVRLDKDGKEVVEKIDNGLPNRTYENKRHESEDFKNASASAKLGAAIKREKPKTILQSAKDWLKEAKDNFYKQWVDKYDALRIFDKAIEDKNGKPVRADQTVLGKMQMVANYASGAARAIIEGDKNSLKPVADTYHIKNLTSLKDMMEKLMADCKAGKFKDYVKSANLDGDTSIQGYINALENYLTALTLLESSQNHKLDYDREVAEWQNKGARGKKPEFEEYKFPNNMTEDEIKDIIRSAPKEFRQYQVIFKGFTDNLLDIMLNSGLITADRYDTLKTRYKFYCPLMRDFSDTAAVDDFISQINSGKGLGNVSDPLKSRSSGGSVRDVISPLTTAVKTASAICMKAERNRVGQYMVRQAKKHRLDEFVHEVKGSSGDANNCIFTVMINGEKHAYQTTPELYPAITAAVKPLCEIQMALLTKPAQLLRAGSTMSPSFILRNFLRDTLFATVASKNGFIPIYDSFRGGYALLKNRERRGEFDAAGVISSNFYSDAETIQKSLTEMAGGKSWQEFTSWEIVKALVSKPVAELEWVSNLIEASTRMGEFMRARDKGKSVEEAAYDAVEITLNFGRSGATGQQINRMVPFFNACIQGGDKLYRLFKSDPKTTMLRIGTYIILPSIVLWAANHDKDWYKELDPAIKMNNWILPGGSIRIPKPQEAGVLFGSGFEAALDAAAGQDQKAMGEWATTFLENMTPGVMPTLILPLIEWMANYSFFRNKPVVSQSMQRLPDELQYGPYTSETSKFVGGIAGVSPAKLDNLWRGYTGTMGMFLIQAPDLWAADKQNLPEKKLSEMAFVRDFAINDMNLNRTMNDFYRLKEAATKQHTGYGKKGKPTAEVAGVNVAAQSISKLQKEAREITASPKYNSAQKRVLVDKLQAKQKKIAQLCIKKYGNKFDY